MNAIINVVSNIGAIELIIITMAMFWIATSVLEILALRANDPAFENSTLSENSLAKPGSVRRFLVGTIVFIVGASQGIVAAPLIITAWVIAVIKRDIYKAQGLRHGSLRWF